MSDSAERVRHLKNIADDLERASLLVRVAARAVRAGGVKSAAVTLSEALEIVRQYQDVANLNVDDGAGQQAAVNPPESTSA